MTERCTRIVVVGNYENETMLQAPWRMCYRGWLRTILTVKINGAGRPGDRRSFWPVITASHIQGAKFKFNSREDLVFDESWGTGEIGAKGSWCAGLVLRFFVS